MRRFFRYDPRKGASIAIALLLFLLLSLGGVTALLMASANMGRYSHSDENKQAYFSASSAALLLVDMLDGLTYRSATAEYIYTHETKYDAGTEGGASGQHTDSETYTLNLLNLDAAAWDSENGYPLNDIGTRAGSIAIPQQAGETEGDAAERLAMENSTLAEAIRLQCDRVFPYRSVPQEWYTAVDKSGKTRAAGFIPKERTEFSFVVRPADSAAGEVSGLLVMDSDYNLTLSFTYYGENGGAYSVSIGWEATVEEFFGRDQSTYTYTESGDVASVSTKRSKYVTATWKKENATVSREEIA